MSSTAKAAVFVCLAAAAGGWAVAEAVKPRGRPPLPLTQPQPAGQPQPDQPPSPNCTPTKVADLYHPLVPPPVPFGTVVVDYGCPAPAGYKPYYGYNPLHTGTLYVPENSY